MAKWINVWKVRCGNFNGGSDTYFSSKSAAQVYADNHDYCDDPVRVSLTVCKPQSDAPMYPDVVYDDPECKKYHHEYLYVWPDWFYDRMRDM